MQFLFSAADPISSEQTRLCEPITSEQTRHVRFESECKEHQRSHQTNPMAGFDSDVNKDVATPLAGPTRRENNDTLPKTRFTTYDDGTERLGDASLAHSVDVVDTEFNHEHHNRDHGTRLRMQSHPVRIQAHPLPTSTTFPERVSHTIASPNADPAVASNPGANVHRVTTPNALQATCDASSAYKHRRLPKSMTIEIERLLNTYQQPRVQRALANSTHFDPFAPCLSRMRSDECLLDMPLRLANSSISQEREHRLHIPPAPAPSRSVSPHERKEGDNSQPVFNEADFEMDTNVLALSARGRCREQKQCLNNSAQKQTSSNNTDPRETEPAAEGPTFAEDCKNDLFGSSSTDQDLGPPTGVHRHSTMITDDDLGEFTA